MEIFINISDNCLVIELFQINRVFLPWDHVIIWLISKVKYFYGLQFCIQNIQTKWLGSQFTTLTWPWRIFSDVFTIKIEFSLNIPQTDNMSYKYDRHENKRCRLFSFLCSYCSFVPYNKQKCKLCTNMCVTIGCELCVNI